MRLAILISGGGRTVGNLQQRIDEGSLAAQIDVVISSRGDVAGVERARKLGLRTVVVERRGQTTESFSRRITKVIGEVDLVGMAGFLAFWRIPDEFLGRVINIHPALLPDFGGKGMYGHHVHEAVLATGRTESGCTVHYCDNQYDHGPIIVQRKVPVLPGDTPDTLAARVFEQECLAYPEAVRMIADGRVRWEAGSIIRT
ncbi:MAG: phosphoribosylglycinamide formyltransferase [Planctomycetes bacterium]|nr:phosphoribosylglycinamide formyltransferase [Planctomycetota bacterium]